MRTLISFTLFILIFLPPAVQADIYRWQDNSGSWHITDDPSTIPSRYRDQVKKEVLPEQPEEEPSPVIEEVPVQTGEGDDKSPEDDESSEADEAEETDKKAEEEKAPEPESSPKAYTIEYTETDNILKLDVTINENHTFSFILDTGATFVSLSEKAAEELGYSMSDILPRTYISTANGVITCNLLRLKKVQVGDAIVHNVNAIVCEDDEDDPDDVRGALGLSFLNEFDWSNDTMNEVLTLREFTNKPGEEVYGGHNEKWWKKKFKDTKKEIEEIDEQLQQLKEIKYKILSQKSTREWYVKILEANREFYMEDLALLDRKANRNSVPRSWR